MNTVTSRFTARKAQSVDPAHTHTELRNALEIRRKNARYAMVLTHRGTNDVNIGKNSTSE